MEVALCELRALIRDRFPQATFAVESGFDPVGIYLVATVDVEDLDDVVDVVGDRLVELQVDEGLPVYLTPLRPNERVVAELRSRASSLHLATVPA